MISNVRTTGPRAAMLCALLLLTIIGSVSCGATSPKPETTPPPATAPVLLQPAAFGHEVILRQHVKATWKNRSTQFHAALQISKTEFSLIGLSPINSVVFAIVLKGGQVSFKKHPRRKFPFSPAFIIADIQRVFFPWLKEVNPNFSGKRSGTQGNQKIEETYANGHLTHRSFSHADGQTNVQIDYQWQPNDTYVPSAATLHSDAYTLSVTTSEQTRLGPRQWTTLKD